MHGGVQHSKSKSWGSSGFQEGKGRNRYDFGFTTTGLSLLPMVFSIPFIGCFFHKHLAREMIHLLMVKGLVHPLGESWL